MPPAVRLLEAGETAIDATAVVEVLVTRNVSFALTLPLVTFRRVEPEPMPVTLPVAAAVITVGFSEAYVMVRPKPISRRSA